MKIYQSNQSYWLANVMCGAVLSFCLESSVLFAQEQKVIDADLTFAVEKATSSNLAIPVNNIDLAVSKGVLTLTGSVDNLLVKEYAVKIASMVKGVRSVVDRLQVKVPRRPDDQIHKDVENALAADPATEPYKIITKVNNGAINFSGTVDSWQEQQLVLRVAKGIRGVKKIENDIQLNYAGTRTDEGIQAEVKRALEIDAWMSGLPIDVMVNNGTVKLVGTVGSFAEKVMAATHARMRGVKAVSTKALRVEPWAKSKMRKKQTLDVKSDEWIRNAVADAFFYDPRVFSFNPIVTVKNGITTLSGTVDNLKAKKAVERDAKNTMGVTRVKNYLKVHPEQSVTDAKLAHNVEDALARNLITKSYKIYAKSFNQVVTLNGAVDSYLEKSEAEDVAQRTKGVIAVKNNLAVDYSMINTWSNASDADIKDEINDELACSPFVNVEQVTVMVNHGVATLTGTADSYQEFNAATKNAYEGGARSVLNRMKIR